MEESPIASGSTADSSGWKFSCNLQVEYPTEENALIIYKVLSVDNELQPDKVKRDMILHGCELHVNFSAVEARFLRASFSAFVDVLVLATKTVEQFGSLVSEMDVTGH
eukprot:TRINITY_DN7848_c0_g1_i1.p1 TRINITY_DN7848_c0_g1~~TRINITY_DN7848_c0_g1_i1.p1  ORF type:complete len:108 (+),score=22.64 TRINITY_DN7848_c0_g1_i1:115-438(+)